MGPFEGCRQRIIRAKAHRNAIAKAWESFLQDDPYGTRLEMNNDGTGIIHIVSRHPLPTEFSLQIGEFLYHLRAALDGIVYQAVILQTGKNPPPNEKNLAFPICGDAEAFKNAHANIAPLSEDLRRFIESIQPYNAPVLAPHEMVYNFNRTLDILNDWARKDRHRQLHVVGSWAANASPNLRYPPGVTLAHMHVIGDCLLKDESEIASFRLNGFVPGMEVHANPDLSIDITLDEIPKPIADNDTFGMRLNAMTRAVELILEFFVNELGQP